MSALRCLGTIAAAMLALFIHAAPADGQASRNDVLKIYVKADRLKKEGKFTEAAREYEHAIALARQAFGEEDVDTASLINNLGNVYRSMNQYARAEPLFKRSLEIREKKQGKDHPDVAQALHKLAELYQEMGRYAETEACYRRALEIRESKLGKDHPHVAFSLQGLAALYLALGQADRAEPYLERSLQIQVTKYGKDHPEVAQSLNNLALVYREMGQLARAEPLYTRSLQMFEKTLPKGHPLIAASLNNLAGLYWAMGKYDRAEPLCVRSLQLREAGLGKDHPELAQTLNNFAGLCRDMGRHAQAESLYTRALQIVEARLGKEHPNLVYSLNGLAALHVDMNQTVRAEPLYTRSVELREKAFGADHPDVAESLNHLAAVLRDLGQYARAETLYLRTLKIWESRYGKDHPHVAFSLGNLARVHAAQGQADRAADYFERSRRSLRRHAARVLPVLAEREQLDFLRNVEAGSLHQGLSFGLQNVGREDLRRRSAEWLLNGKAVAQEALAAGPRAALGGSDPRSGALFRELQGVRRQLARLSLSNVAPGQEAVLRQRREELTAQERDLASRIGRLSGFAEKEDPWVSLADLCKRLPADAVFIDIAHVDVHDFQARSEAERWKQPHYVAWTTYPTGRVEVVDLGPAAAIDVQVKKLRQHMNDAPRHIRTEGEPDAEKECQTQLEALARLVLHPLLPHVGAKRSWVLSPDRDLWLVPWGALPLPDGTYAVEKHTISYVTSGRDFFRRRVKVGKSDPALVLADPDFDLGLDQVAVRSRELSGQSETLPKLAGLKLPGKIGPWTYTFEFRGSGELRVYDSDRALAGEGTWKQSGASLSMQTRVARLEGTLLAGAVIGRREKRETDGAITRDAWQVRLPEDQTRSAVFILPSEAEPVLPKVGPLPGTAAEAKAVAPRLKEYTGAEPQIRVGSDAVKAVVLAASSPKVLLLSTHGFFLPAPEQGHADTEKKGQEHVNPLLRCGVLLAGCNDKDDPGQGVLTGLEVAGLDLRGTDLVVLSACETGVGEARQGEGVAGLRQAFQLAGAETVVATLWQVSDRQSAQQMARFFALLAQGRSKSAALAEAQRELIQSRRRGFGAAHPFFWAAFTVTGERASP